jgi:coronin-1B/1C/6
VSTPTPTAAPSGPSASGVESSLDQIKLLLENQTRIITAQNEKIGQLAAEVDAIKRKMGSGSQDQSERIRQLELELEEARS